LQHNNEDDGVPTFGDDDTLMEDVVDNSLGNSVPHNGNSLGSGGHNVDSQMEVAEALPAGQAVDDTGMETNEDWPPPLRSPLPKAPISDFREKFDAYVAHAEQNYAELPPEFKAAIELMHLLNVFGAPITLYDKLMDWHIQYDSACTRKVTRKELLKKLRDRYNMQDTQPYEVECVLPKSRVKVKIPCHDAGAMIADLLTDTRIGDKDYLFHNDDPLSPPPEEWLTLEDINSGLAYRETYDQLIRPNPITESGRHRVLLPVIFYMDGTVTGSMQALSIEVFKFTLGIFNCSARDKEYSWRNLGMVPRYEKTKRKAKVYIQNTGHKEAECYLTDSESESEDSLNEGKPKGKSSKVRPRWVPDFDVGPYIDEDVVDNKEDEDQFLLHFEEEEGLYDAIEDPDEEQWEEDEYPEPPISAPTIPDGGPGRPNQSMQDFHKILHVIMHSYRKLQDSLGIEWDLVYKGKLYELQFIPFCVFVKGDTVEHDKHCGKYGSRTKGVKQLCRYCQCPQELTSDPHHVFPRKTQTQIQQLVRKRNVEALHNMSQKFIWNAWYEIRFGLHNDYGIHGACPVEPLHWILLGQYKYSIQMFFEQTGNKSILADVMETVVEHLGWLFQRQSDKSFPRTMFKEGIRSAYLQGHEFTGVMLVLATALRTTKGRQDLLKERRGKQKHFFHNKKFINDWIMMLETQIELEQFLKLRTMDVPMVQNLQEKAKDYMQLTKTVGKRQSGQGFNTMNFHAFLHVPDDILNFGPSRVVNVMCNESHHIPDKKSAKRTQRRPKTFDMQTAKQMEDRRVIEFAAMELLGACRWSYFDEYEVEEGVGPPNPGIAPPVLGGVQARFSYCEEQEKYTYSLKTEMKEKHKYIYKDKYFLEKMSQVAFQVEEYLDSVVLHSELTFQGTIYRAAPHFLGKPWWDWALFRFREDNEETDNPNNPAGTPFVEYEEDEVPIEPAVKPAHLRGFIDLRNLPDDNNTGYMSTIYAFVECVRRNNHPDEQIPAQIFQPYVKISRYNSLYHQTSGSGEWVPKFSLLPIEKLYGPAVVIPDLGNSHPKAFIRVAAPSEWSGFFQDWLEQGGDGAFDEEQSR